MRKNMQKVLDAWMNKSAIKGDSKGTCSTRRGVPSRDAAGNLIERSVDFAESVGVVYSYELPIMWSRIMPNGETHVWIRERTSSQSVTTRAQLNACAFYCDTRVRGTVRSTVPHDYQGNRPWDDHPITGAVLAKKGADDEAQIAADLAEATTVPPAVFSSPPREYSIPYVYPRR